MTRMSQPAQTTGSTARGLQRHVVSIQLVHLMLLCFIPDASSRWWFLMQVTG